MSSGGSGFVGTRLVGRRQSHSAVYDVADKTGSGS